MSSQSSKRQELERKKALLAEMRQTKLQRERQAQNGGSSITASSNGHRLQETDELLANLGLLTTCGASGDHAAAISTNGSSANVDLTSSPDGVDKNGSSALDSSRHHHTPEPTPPPKLSRSTVSELTIQPKDPIVYSKLTQTLDLGVHHFASPREVDISSPKFITNMDWDDEFSQMLTFDEGHNGSVDVIDQTPIKMPLTSPIEAAKTALDRSSSDRRLLGANNNGVSKYRTITDDDRNRIMQDDRFQTFFQRSVRVIERALGESNDVLVEYSGIDRDDSADTSSRHQLIRLGRQFYDERWSRRRTVIALDWSPAYPELLLTAYQQQPQQSTDYISSDPLSTANSSSSNDPDGLCLIWNLKFAKQAPEYVFHCPSQLTSASFLEFHPNLVVGGTYSGQLVLWDNRVAKRTPIQRTPLITAAHTRPVHALQLAGRSSNSHELISVSSDGRLCSWSLDMLGQPLQSLDLNYRQNRNVPATSLGLIQTGGFDQFVVGADDHHAYAGYRNGNQSGVVEQFEGHQAPLTSVSTHPGDGPIDFSSLFITTSLDWSVKLWSVGSRSHQRQQQSSSGSGGELVYSFDDDASNDYLMHSDWSPIHPAVFATAACNGQLDLWNLNQDFEVPWCRTWASSDGSKQSATALNQCRFHASGLHLAAGDDSGHVYMFDLNEAMMLPHADEWTAFAATIAELRARLQEQRDQEADSLFSSSSHLPSSLRSMS